MMINQKSKTKKEVVQILMQARWLPSSPRQSSRNVRMELPNSAERSTAMMLHLLQPQLSQHPEKNVSQY
jgi:hypothetical protein